MAIHPHLAWNACSTDEAETIRFELGMGRLRNAKKYRIPRIRTAAEGLNFRGRQGQIRARSSSPELQVKKRQAVLAPVVRACTGSASEKLGWPEIVDFVCFMYYSVLYGVRMKVSPDASARAPRRPAGCCHHAHHGSTATTRPCAAATGRRPTSS
jgi:hypothetical protein